MTAELAGELNWPGDWGDQESGPDLNQDLAGALRSALHEQYAGASDEELQDALDNVLDGMSPAEGFNFGAALSQIGKSANRLVSDPTFIQIAKTAAPIAGGALGSIVGGPIGTALGTQLGNLAVGALPAARPSVPAQPPASAPAAAPAPVPPPTPGAAPALSAAAVTPPVAAPVSPVAGGSAAAAQGMVLTQQPDVLRSLLATALGQHGRREINGVPAAQVLSMLSQVFGQAAADADELMYTDQPEASEGVADDVPGGPSRQLYVDLLGADNLELAEAADLAKVGGWSEADPLGEVGGWGGGG